MKRRDLLKYGMLASAGAVLARAMSSSESYAAKVIDKDILKEGQPATVANYCKNPTQQPNKFCPGAKDRPGSCATCQFWVKDSEAEFGGKKIAKCQLLSDPKKPQYVEATSWCATFVKKA